MTLEQLIAGGLTAEQAQKVLDLHKEDLKNYVPAARLAEVVSKQKSAEDQLAERDRQITALQTFKGNSEELAAKVASLEAENKQKAVEFASQLEHEKKVNAVRFAINGQVHDSDLLIGLLDMSKIIVDVSGNVVGLSEQVEPLKKEKAFLFKTAGTTPPAGATGAEGTPEGPWANYFQKPAPVQGQTPPAGATPPVNPQIDVNSPDFGLMIAKALGDSKNNAYKETARAEEYYFKGGNQ